MRGVLRFAGPALLAVAACQDSGAPNPTRPTSPRVQVAVRPVDQPYADTVITLSGAVGVPGRIDRLVFFIRPTPASLFDTATLSSVAADRSTASFTARVRVRPGIDTLQFTVEWRGDNGSRISTDTIMVFRAFKAPSVVITGPDTIDGVAYQGFARTTGGITQRLLADSMVIDSETTAEVHRGPSNPFFSGTATNGDGGFTISSLPLSAGAHRVQVYFTADIGPPIVAEKRFVIQHGTTPYVVNVLPDLGFGAGEAFDINASGTIVGWARRADGEPVAVKWTNGLITQLDSDTTRAMARAVNDQGVIAGGSVSPVFSIAYRWLGTQRTVLTSTNGNALDINADGTVLLPHHLVSGATLSALPATIDFARRMNDRGQVIGDGHIPHGNVTAVGVGLAILPPPAVVGGPFPSSIADVMNNAGQVAGRVLGPLGQVFLADDGQRGTGMATVFGPNGCEGRCNAPAPFALTDDGTLAVFNPGDHSIVLWRAGHTTRVTIIPGGWQIDALNAMNANGQMVGKATNVATGMQAAVVLSPVVAR